LWRLTWQQAYPSIDFTARSVVARALAQRAGAGFAHAGEDVNPTSGAEDDVAGVKTRELPQRHTRRNSTPIINTT
jgi:hypothetical protein